MTNAQSESGIKRFLPNAIIIALFLIIGFVYCRPALQGEKIAPHDTVSWLYMSKEGRDYIDSTGNYPGWVNNMFGGMPMDIIHMYSNNNWFKKISNVIEMNPADFLPNPASFFILAMISFFILMRSLRVNRWLGAIGAIAFAFSSYNPIIIMAGHVTKMLDIAFLPGAIAGMIWIYRKQYGLGIITSAFFFAFFFAAWHPQIIYYSIFLFVAIAIGLLIQHIKQKDIVGYVKSSAILLVVVTLAALTSFTNIKGTAQYAKHSIRGGQSELTINNKQKSDGLDKDYAFQWSNGIGETFCILIPNLYGGSSSEKLSEDSNYGKALSTLAAPAQVSQMVQNAPTYWGDQPFLSGPIYFGAIICFFFVLGLIVIKHPIKWWATGIILLMMMISWGKNLSSFNYFLFDTLPLFNKFRTPSMALAIPSLIMPAIGIWGLCTLFSNNNKEESFAAVKKALYITGGLTLIIIIASQVMFDYVGAVDAQLQNSFGQASTTLLRALREDRASLALSDGIRSLVFILIGAGALWLFVKDRINQTAAVAILGLATVIDVMPVAHRYLNSDKFMDEYTLNQTYFAPREVDKQILQDTDPNYRVLDLTISTYSESKSSYFHKTIGGYNPAKMEIYQDLIDMQLSKNNVAVLNMLNTKYVIYQGQNGQPAVMPNPQANGNAWFVSNIKKVATADEEMLALNGPTLGQPIDSTMTNMFDPLNTAVLRNEFASKVSPNIGKSEGANIKLTKYDLPYLRYESDNAQTGLAVFSEIYYPENWKAFIDNKEVPILRANYVLRALEVPAGKHVIEFKYENATYQGAESVSLVASILLSIAIAGGIFLVFKECKKNKAANA